jgi:hypothetical protein
LLEYLVDVLFERPDKGTPPKWNADRWMQFEGHVAVARERLANNNGKPPKKKQIADFLKKEFKPFYDHISPGTIRRYLSVPPPAVRKLQRRALIPKRTAI